jgi:hypothetical protein
MSKHTPGPWTFVQGGSGDFPTWNVRIGNRGLITLPATASMETMDADARLIAAAPDLVAQRDALLEALRVIAGLITNEPARQKALDAIKAVEDRQ